MRALIIQNPLPSTASLLQFAISNKERFKSVRGLVDGIEPIHEVSKEFSGLVWKHPTIRELIGTAYDQLYARREEIRELFNLRRLEWKESRIGFNSLGNGDEYAPHIDAGKIAGPNIEIAFLLYFSSTPRRFSGGELVLHWHDGDEVITPEDNTLVVFPGSALHSINKVQLSSDDFGHRRFGVVGRIIGSPTPIQLGAKLATRVLRPLRRLIRSL